MSFDSTTTILQFKFNMNDRFKTLWAWFCGIAAGPAAILTPYIASWNWHLTNEAKGGIVLSILAGLGLVQMKRPGDHSGEEARND